MATFAKHFASCPANATLTDECTPRLPPPEHIRQHSALAPPLLTFTKHTPITDGVLLDNGKGKISCRIPVLEHPPSETATYGTGQITPRCDTTALVDKSKITSDIVSPMITTPYSLQHTPTVTHLTEIACPHAPSMARERTPLEGETHPTATQMLCLTSGAPDGLCPPQKSGTTSPFTGSDKSLLRKQKESHNSDWCAKDASALYSVDEAHRRVLLTCI